MGTIDITSSAVEKAIDGAKSFLALVLKPAAEEVGLLVKDKIASFRFNTQVKVLEKAMRKCKENNISIKSINLKLLAPLLEYASLEDNDTLQDKWSNLLVNMVDSKQNIDNHVLPYILSQLSIEEYIFLEDGYVLDTSHFQMISASILEIEKQYTSDQREAANQLALLEIPSEDSIPLDWEIYHERKKELQQKISPGHSKAENLKMQLSIKMVLDVTRIGPVEKSNLFRLGLIDIVTSHKAVTDRARTLFGAPVFQYNRNGNLNLKIQRDKEQCFLSPLGSLFIQACSEKKDRHNK